MNTKYSWYSRDIFLIQMYISIFILSLFKLIEDGRKRIVSCAEHIMEFFVFHSSPLVLLPRISLTRIALESPALSYLPLLLVCFTPIFSCIYILYFLHNFVLNSFIFIMLSSYRVLPHQLCKYRSSTSAS